MAAVNGVLHFRIFDRGGEKVVDTDEKEEKLKEKAGQIEDLSKQLKSLWLPHELTGSEKNRVMTAITSIVGQTPVDKAIEILERGVKALPEEGDLRLRLTEFLAMREDTVKLLEQIDELKKQGYAPVVIQFFTACYYVNARQFLKAKPILISLLQAVPVSEFKSKIGVLLARCYKELGEPEMQQNEFRRALTANPNDLTARLGYIDNLVSQGDTAGAINEYRGLQERVPAVRSILARLLIEQNERRPAPQRNWDQAKKLIDQMAETEPESVEPVILEAAMAVCARQASGRLVTSSEGPGAVSQECRRSELLRPISWELRSELKRGSSVLDQARAATGRSS